MKCQNHEKCGDYCETPAEISAHMCGNCVESDKQREDDASNLVELRLAMDLMRRAAGLPENLTAHEMACKVAERLANLERPASQWKPFNNAPMDGGDVDLWSKRIGRIADCHYDKLAMRWKCGVNTVKTSHITHFMMVDSPKDS